jgi:hypothetical protein
MDEGNVRPDFEKRPQEEEWEFVGKDYVTVLPTNRQVQEANIESSIAFSSALRREIMTREEMRIAMQDRGILEDEEKIALEEYQSRITDLIVKMNDPDVPIEAKEKVAVEIKELRGKRLEAHTKIEELLGRSAEAVADEVRHACLTYSCTFSNSNGKHEPAFKDFDEFLDCRDLDLCCEAATRLLTLLHGFSPELLSQRIEDVILDAARGEMAKTAADGISSYVEDVVDGEAAEETGVGDNTDERGDTAGVGRDSDSATSG